MKKAIQNLLQSEKFRLIFPIALIFLSGVANGIMDTLQFHYSSSIFAHFPASWQTWLNPSTSWVLKWQIGDEGQVILKERFWGSSTWFASFTDAWHLFKFIYQNSLIAAFAFLLADLLGRDWKVFLLLFIGSKMLQMIGFTLFYDFIL